MPGDRGGDGRHVADRSATRRRAGLRRWVRGPRLSAARAAALLGLLAASGAAYGLAATPTFTLSRTELPTLTWTAREALVVAIGPIDGTNLFRLEVAPIERRLRQLPAVADAAASVRLPDLLVIEVRERRPILAWAVGDARFLVDRDGVLFATTEPAAVTSGGLPTITDTRPTAAGLNVGDVIDPVDLDAATRLGSLVPADIESIASALVITVTEANGFVVGTVPRTWVAIFGLYTPTLRTPAIIPDQVRLLRSLLHGREGSIQRVILADGDSGTFIPRATPAPSAAP